MGYNLHITRKKNYTDDTGLEITAEEWLAYVASDSELCLNPDNGPYFVRILKRSEYPEPWLDWLDGEIVAKNPDPPIIIKMLQIATALNATVQGDDGETYLEDPDKKGEFMVEQPIDCCPPFDPAPWDDQVFEWDSKPFIRDKVFTLFYVPMNFGKVIRRLDAKVKSAGATIPDNLCLSDHTSKWNMDIYLAVDKEIPGAQNTTLTGKFFSKVYDGPYKDTGKWCKDFQSLTAGRGLTLQKWYMWYTSCPKCAKKFGKNYVAIIAEVK